MNIGIEFLNPPEVIEQLRGSGKRPKYGVNTSKAAKLARGCDGFTFDSDVERARYDYLKVLAEAGVITDLDVHPLYTLIPKGKTKHGKHNRAVTFELDFRYRLSGVLVVEDVKGAITRDFTIKRKFFNWLFPDITFHIVKKKGKKWDVDVY